MEGYTAIYWWCEKYLAIVEDDKHLLYQVLSKFSNAKDTLEVKKCEFSTNTAKYFGPFIILGWLELFVSYCRFKIGEPRTTEVELCSSFRLCNISQTFVYS